MLSNVRQFSGSLPRSGLGSAGRRRTPYSSLSGLRPRGPLSWTLEDRTARGYIGVTTFGGPAVDSMAELIIEPELRGGQHHARGFFGFRISLSLMLCSP